MGLNRKPKKVNSEALDNLIGEVFTIMVLTVAAGEIAIGLAILISFHAATVTKSRQ